MIMQRKLITILMALTFLSVSQIAYADIPNLSQANMDKGSVAVNLDTHREIPGFLDIGIFQTYRLSQNEIQSIDEKILKEVIETYIRRYYDLYLYFSRDIISKQCTDNYPANLIDPVVNETLQKPTPELRQMLTKFYHDQNGVTEENKRLYGLISEILNQWDIEKFKKSKAIIFPPTHSANAIFLAYLKKLGVRHNNYYPPFLPPAGAENQAMINTSQQQKTQQDRTNLIYAVVIFIAGVILGNLLSRRNKK